MQAVSGISFLKHPIPNRRYNMGRVSIVRTDEDVSKSLRRALDLIGGLERFVKRSDRVMLKPNLNGADVYTNKELVGALVEMLMDTGVARVFIAESTFGDARMTKMFFNKTGYTELAARYGIDLINLNESEAVDVKVENPLVLDSIHIAKEVYEADKIINLPSLKVHYATGISLALKNLKGFLVGSEKRHCHEIGLDKAIVDLNNTLKVDLNIADCITCMEHMGPHGGDPVDLNLLLAGGNRAEVDYVACQITEYDISEVNHLQQYVEMNGIDLSAVDVIGETIEGVKYPLKKVAMANCIPQEITVYDTGACSTCMNALILSCCALKGKLTKPVDVHLGAKTEEDVISPNLKVAFGNCCVKYLKADRSVNGCPPYPFALAEVLRDILKPNT
jgi:uncharacterized protein (DUF362 family)